MEIKHTPSETNSNEQLAYVDFEYPGNWASINSTLKILLNGSVIRELAFKSGLFFSFPINPGSNVIEAKLSFRSTRFTIDAQPGRRYNLVLSYNRFWGSIKLRLTK